MKIRDVISSEENLREFCDKFFQNWDNIAPNLFKNFASSLTNPRVFLRFLINQSHELSYLQIFNYTEKECDLMFDLPRTLKEKLITEILQTLYNDEITEEVFTDLREHYEGYVIGY